MRSEIAAWRATLIRVAAAIAGWGHEIAGLLRGQAFAEAFMDLHNNREGRRAGAENRLVDAANLINNADSTRTNAGQYATNNQYADPCTADLAAGKPAHVGPTKVEYNKDTGTATLTTEYTGSRIRSKVEVKVEIESK